MALLARKMLLLHCLPLLLHLHLLRKVTRATGFPPCDDEHVGLLDVPSDREKLVRGGVWLRQSLSNKKQ